MVDGDIQDLRTDQYDGFKEITKIVKNDIELCTDAEVLWGAIAGEIKTPYGVIDGVGLENYGCRIWNLVGVPLEGLILREAKNYIGELADKYEEVNSFRKIKIIPYGRNYIQIEIDVDSIYGRFTGIERISLDIVNSFTKREKRGVIGGEYVW